MKIKDNFWNNLKKYNPEQYVGESIDPLVVVSLFKLYESQESTSMESIAVTAFKLFPDKFSMTQFPEYPDYMRVFTAVRMHLKKYVEGDMKKNSFLLNGKGRIYAEEILERFEFGTGSSSKPKKEFKRKKNTKLILAVTKTIGFKKFEDKNLDKINRFDICETLHCTTEASDEHLRTNLATLQQMANQIAPNLSYKKEAEKVLEFLTFADENWKRLMK
ncbi:MAG: hypothetical protein HOD60_14590 [Candidatus Nitrosopelagicus sp.]|nr:hypothetical protein [Candidatus Nitrosopelagicus sp.]